jgi:hypothetical protein
LPTAATITIKETLDLLDGPYLGVSEGVTQGRYAFWLGSGISRDRVIGLDGVLAKLVEFLRTHATAGPECGYREALDKIIDMAVPSADARAQIDLCQPSSTWPCLPNLLSRLWDQYSRVLSVEIPKKKLDYLLWVGLDFANTFAIQDADAEHLAIGMLALEGTVVYMLPPLPRCSRWAYSSLILAQPYQPSPKGASGRPAHRPFRGLLGVHSRCGLHTRTVTYS